MIILHGRLQKSTAIRECSQTRASRIGEDAERNPTTNSNQCSYLMHESKFPDFSLNGIQGAQGAQGAEPPC